MTVQMRSLFHLFILLLPLGIRSQTCHRHAFSSFTNATRLGVCTNISEAECCSKCGADESCALYNWHPVGFEGQPTFCELLAAGAALEPASRRSNFSAGSVSTRPPVCTSAQNCSLAGECIAGRCHCDGWTHGERCEILNLMPADPASYGYRNTSTADGSYNSWGGASIEYQGRWYLFASQVVGHCPLNGYWDGGSTAIRAVSHSGAMGPWANVTTIIPRMAHNVKPFRAPDGSWLIYFIGEPNHDKPSYYNCTLPPQRPGALSPQPTETAGPVMIASAASPDAPREEWIVHGPITDSVAWHSATNPSPIFFPNGSVLLAVSRAWTNTNTSSQGCQGKRTVLMVADHWRGPYRNLSWTTTCSGAIDTGEDPDLFRTYVRLLPVTFRLASETPKRRGKTPLFVIHVHSFLRSPRFRF